MIDRATLELAAKVAVRHAYKPYSTRTLAASRIRRTVMDEQSTVFEAVITFSKPNKWGQTEDHIDPVLRVIIDNGFHCYEYGPDEIAGLQVRALASGGNNA